MQEKKILEYQKKETNLEDGIIEKTKDYYEESKKALIGYMEEHEQNPSEKKWDRYVIDKQYLSSKTMGYLSQVGFNTLCRKLRKEINKNKRQR